MISENNPHKILQIKVKKAIKKSKKIKEYHSKEIDHERLREAKIKILLTTPKIIGFHFSYKIPGEIYVDDCAPPKDIFVCLM